MGSVVIGFLVRQADVYVWLALHNLLFSVWRSSIFALSRAIYLCEC